MSIAPSSYIHSQHSFPTSTVVEVLCGYHWGNPHPELNAHLLCTYTFTTMYIHTIHTEVWFVCAYSVFTIHHHENDAGYEQQKGFVNDPSAGSPTETLLRLLLPLNDQV